MEHFIKLINIFLFYFYFLHFRSMLFVVIGLIIQGLALGMICVPTFVDSMRAAL